MSRGQVSSDDTSHGLGRQDTNVKLSSPNQNAHGNFILSTFNPDQGSNLQTKSHCGEKTQMTLHNSSCSRNWVSENHRKDLQELVRRQRRLRAAARKTAEERERERNQRIVENLAATAKAAKLAAKRALNAKKGEISVPLAKNRCRTDLISGINCETDEIPPECVLRASELLAEEEANAHRKLNCPVALPTCSVKQSKRGKKSRNHLFSATTQPSLTIIGPRKTSQSLLSSIDPHVPPTTHLEILRNSFPDCVNTKSQGAKPLAGCSGAAIISASLPLRSRTVKSSDSGFLSKVSSRKVCGIQVDLNDSIAVGRNTDIISSWKDAESEHARLQARLCASRGRRFVHLNPDGDEFTASGSVSGTASSSSSSVSSRSNSVSEHSLEEKSRCRWRQQVPSQRQQLRQRLHALKPAKAKDDVVTRRSDKALSLPYRNGLREAECSGSLKSLFDSHLKHLQERSEHELDPLRFMEVYKRKCQQLTITHQYGDSQLDNSMRGEGNDSRINCGDCDTISEGDKTSEGASSIPSLVAETCQPTKEALSHDQYNHETQIQRRRHQRLHPAALGLSLTAELHRYETLSASEQHIAGLEMTRQISQAQAQGLSIYQLAKAGYFNDAQGANSSFMRVEHVKKELKNTAVSPIVFPRGGAPVTVNQTITQRSYTNTTNTAATPDAVPVHGCNQRSTVGFLKGTKMDGDTNGYADASNTNVNDVTVTPSTLEVTIALGDLVDLRSEQFRGILQQRASELHARRHEAELLLKYAAKLDREERKVAVLESRAVKAVVRPKNRHPALDALVSPPQSSHSTSASVPTLKAPKGTASYPPSLPSPLHPPTATTPTAPIPTSSSSSSTTAPSSSSTALLSNGETIAKVRENVCVSEAQHSNVMMTSSRSNNPTPKKCLHTRDEQDDLTESATHDSVQNENQFRQRSATPPPQQPNHISTNSTVSSPSGFRAHSDSISSLEFVSHLETRLNSLQRDLRRNEKLLGQIDTQKKRANRDRLMRLEMTLENHRKFCLEIINSIKSEINSCYESLSEKSSQVDAAATTPGTPTVPPHSTSLSEPSSAISDSANLREQKQDVEYATSSQLSSSDDEEEAVQNSFIVSLGRGVTSTPSESDSLKSSRGETFPSSRSGLNGMENNKQVVCVDIGKTAVTECVNGETWGPTVSSVETISSKLSQSNRLLASPVDHHETDSNPATLQSAPYTNANGTSPPQSETSSNPSPVVRNSPVLTMNGDSQKINHVNSKRHRTVGSEGNERSPEMVPSKVPSIASTSNGTDLSIAVAKTAIGYATVSETSVPFEHKISPVESDSQDLTKTSTLEKVSSVEALNGVNKPESVGSIQSGKAIKKREDEWEGGGRGCPTNSISSELSCEIPPLSSEDHSAEIHELTSKKTSTRQFSSGSNPESASDTGDVYTEDFEDDEFANDEEPQNEVRDAVKTTPEGVGSLSLSDQLVDTKADILLDEFMDLWLEDVIDEEVYSIAGEEDTLFSSDDDLITDTTGMIVNTPSRTVPLFKDALEFFFQLRASTKPGTFEQAINSAPYPPRFNQTCMEDEDLEICQRIPESRLVNRLLFFDLVRIGMSDIFAGEDEDIKNNREPRLTSARLHMWHGKRRPESISRWEEILAPQLEAILGISLDPAAVDGPSPPELPKPQVFDPSVSRSNLVQWTLNLKQFWIDQLLITELREEDFSWLNYKPFEQEAINVAVSELAREIAGNVVDNVLSKPNSPDERETLMKNEKEKTEE